MRVAVTGSSGLIGQALCERLRQEGHTILHMVRTRSAQADDTCYWNPEIREIDAGRLADSDAVVHLAGESVDRYAQSMSRSPSTPLRRSTASLPVSRISHLYSEKMLKTFSWIQRHRPT